MAAFLLISPFRGCGSSQIPWSCTECFGSSSWRVRTEQELSHNNLTAQSPPGDQLSLYTWGRLGPSTPAPAWNVAAPAVPVAPERAPGDCDGGSSCWKEKAGNYTLGILEFHTEGLTSIFWSLPVAFTYTFSAK